VTSGANKFHRTDFEKLLKDKGITAVIVPRGQPRHGAVLNTAAAAALLGFKVILPVDAMSADPYAEQNTAWHLVNAPRGIGPNVTLIKMEMTNSSSVANGRSVPEADSIGANDCPRRPRARPSRYRVPRP
jgi:L-ascorbate metabolism protein UlaG (beta-lactamase superfamily)